MDDSANLRGEPVLNGLVYKRHVFYMNCESVIFGLDIY